MEVTYDVCLCLCSCSFTCLCALLCIYVEVTGQDQMFSSPVSSPAFILSQGLVIWICWLPMSPSNLLASNSPVLWGGVKRMGSSLTFFNKSWRGDLWFSCLTTAPTLQSMTDVFMVFLVHDLSCLTVYLSCLQASL